jgi:hypothetical protein
MLDLGHEPLDVVANAALAEFAEAGEVAPDLRRVHVGERAQLLAGDRLLAFLAGLTEHLEIPRQARCDAQRQAFGDYVADRHSAGH